MKPNRSDSTEGRQALRIRRAILFAALPLLWLMAGCGLTLSQRTAVLKFSGATKEFATITAQEFAQSRMDVIQMNTFRAKLSDPDVNPDKLDEHFTVARVQERVDAVRALEHYADLLQALASGSKAAELKVAADGFVTSLRKVNGVNLSDEKAGAIGQAVQLVGGLVVEHMRAKAIRRVVESTDGPVLQLLDLVKRDFSPEAEHWSLGYEKVAAVLQNRAALAKARAGEADVANLAVIEEARVLARENRTRFKATAEQILPLIDKLRTAQEHLRLSLQSKEITTERVDDYIRQLQDFANIYKILRGN